MGVSDAQNDAVVVHMKENQYITKEELRRNQVATARASEQ